MSQELYTNYIKILSSVEIQNDLYVEKNIGIGTLLPTEVLDVNGNTKISGNLSVNSNVHILSTLLVDKDVTILGKLSALGDSYFANTIFSTTSAICAYNTGPGPALYVYQAAGPYDVASFYDGDGVEVLHVGNAGVGGNGRVGINNGDPNKELSVKGSISATEEAFIDGNVLIGVSRISNLTVTGEISTTNSLYVGGNLIQKDLQSVYTSVNNTSSNWDNVYTSVNVTSGNWNDVYTSVNNTSGNWNDVYTTVQSYSGSSWNQTLSFNENTDILAIRDSNSLSLSSITQNNKNYTHTNFLPLSGGLINGDLTVTGNLSSLGTITYLDSLVSVTSALEVTNIGSGPALKVTQTGNQDVASFYDDSVIALVVKDGGNIGIGTLIPNKKLTVTGEISSTGNVSIDGNLIQPEFVDLKTKVSNLSGNWDDVYTSVNLASGNWNNVYTSVNNTSGNWNNVYTSVNNTSGNWNNVYTTTNNISGVYTTVNNTSGNWNNVYTSVYNTSGNWNNVYTTVNLASSDWYSTYSFVSSNSSDIKNANSLVFNGKDNWNNVYTSVNNTSGNWNNVYTTTNNISGNWNNVYTSVNNTSGNWDDVYNTFKTASSTFLTSETDSQTLSFDEITKNLSITNGNTISLSALTDITATDTGVRALTGDWNSTYTTVLGNSSQWASNIDTDVRSLSGNWQNTYSNYSTNSAVYVKTVATTVPGTSAIPIIVAVSALPVSPDPNTLYIVI